MRRTAGFLVEAIEILLLTVVAYALIQAFVAQPFRVEQGSMETTLRQGQYILIDKLTPRFDDYSRGDIIVFRAPPDARDAHDTPFVKRVIGLPGDQVEIHHGLVWIDGMPLDESAYVYGEERTTTFRGDYARWDVPGGSLFVLGDHRTNSTDSRMTRIGLVPIDSVIGRAVLRYWPVPDMAVLQAPTYPPSTAGRVEVVSLPGSDSP